MAQISIIDTGFQSSARLGEPKKNYTDKTSLGTYVCNNGNPITLKCPRINLRGGTNLIDEPNPSSNKATETHFNTFDNDMYEVPFIIDVTDSDQRDLLKEINLLRKTIGVKLLYSSDTSTNLKALPEILGRIDTKFNTSSIKDTNLVGIPLFICRVIGISIDNIATSRKFMITGKLTIKEEQVKLT